MPIYFALPERKVAKPLALVQESLVTPANGRLKQFLASDAIKECQLSSVLRCQIALELFVTLESITRNLSEARIIARHDVSSGHVDAEAQIFLHFLWTCSVLVFVHDISRVRHHRSKIKRTNRIGVSCRN